MAPTNDKKYQVYRAVVDYSTSTPETRVFVKAFDLYITESSLTPFIQQSLKDQTPLAALAPIDADIAFGYITIDTKTAQTTGDTV